MIHGITSSRVKLPAPGGGTWAFPPSLSIILTPGTLCFLRFLLPRQMIAMELPSLSLVGRSTGDGIFLLLPFPFFSLGIA